MPDFPNADDLLERNARYAAEEWPDDDADVVPDRNLAVVACMDARMDIYSLLGLGNGEAHIIRNAGGVVTDDVIRSLCLSQRKLETREIILLHHTDCGLSTVDEDDFKAEVQAETGVKPWWSLEAFRDVDDDVRQSIERLRLSPFILHKDHIRGFVYEVESGRLREVTST